jgi:hypothetical protein
MVDEDRDLPVPGPFGRWLSDLFNDWGPGGRAGAAAIRGPDPATVPASPDGTPRAAVVTPPVAAGPLAYSARGSDRPEQ